MRVCDDAYLRLALHIISHYPKDEIKQALEDDEWLKARVREECMQLDFSGPFLDTIMQGIDTHNSLWFWNRLREISAIFYQKLDTDQLREKIIQLVQDI